MTKREVWFILTSPFVSERGRYRKHKVKGTEKLEYETEKDQTETIVSLPPVVAFEYEEYEALLEDPDTSEDEKRALLEIIWIYVTAFIDLGFGVHPVQQAMKQPKISCGKLEENSPKPALTAPDGVNYNSYLLTENFVKTADLEKDAAVGRVEG